jgi:hypothetical protein
MKKLLFILLLISLTSVTITSCTEEEVKPQTESSGVGGEKIKE